MKASPLKRAGLIGLGLSLLLCLSSNLIRADAAVSVAAVTSGPTIYLPLLMKNFCAATLPPPGNWLAYVNYYRALACLPAVTENASYTDGDQKHARYMVKNDVVIDHTEYSFMPWYTPEGAAAGLNSNVMGVKNLGNDNYTDEQAIDSWMRAPFHAVRILDPKLLQTGFGSFREVGDNSSNDVQMAAALDIQRGLGSVPASVTFPVKWPSDGMTVNLRSFLGDERPDPRTKCGYSGIVGLPIILQLGIGNTNPSGTTGTFKLDGTTLPSCVFDETNYTNPNSGDQQRGLDILNAYDAIVVLPQAQLTRGETYTVSITTNGQTYTWSFTVSLSATPLETAPEAVIR